MARNENFQLATATLLSVLAFALYRRISRPVRPPYPPGPQKHILWGNLFQMPLDYEYLTFREWSKQHGPVMHLSVPGQSIIVLDKLEAASDLLDTRALIYSDRPTLTMLRDVIGWDWSIVMFNYGERFKKYRKVLHRGLNADPDHYTRIQEHESRRLVKNLLKDPRNFLALAERWGRSMISRVSYDYDPHPEQDRYIWVAGQCEDIIARTARPGAYLVDVFPLLKYVPKWLPFTAFKREAETWSLLVQEFLESPYHYITQKLAAGTAAPCYVSMLLRDMGESLNPDDEKAIKDSIETAAVVHFAGANSTYATLQAFILAMTLYPNVQRKAQAEIDAVVGSQRLPILSDRPNLPYINCIVSEMWRWTRSAPLGAAHQLKQDDIYKGMFLPAGSIVLANSWSMTRDEHVYDNPDEFLPERFQKEGMPDPRDIVFGFGRRVCPGRNLADGALFTAIATILTVLQISKARDERGKEIVPGVYYTPGFVCKLKPFCCEIVARSGSAVELLEEGSDI